MSPTLLNYIKTELEKYNNSIDVVDRLNSSNYSLNFNNLPNCLKEMLVVNTSNYECQQMLVDNLSNMLNLDFSNHELNFYIINKWGGIFNFKNSEINKSKIIEFRRCLLQNENIKNNHFEVISSLSKVAFFANPNEYFIYDSRVIYSLNYLILKYQISTKDDCVKYFPLPTSRNNNLRAYDYNIIINCINKNLNNLYYDFSIAYYKYCDFIKILSNENYLNFTPKYLVERLLFDISIKEILEEVKGLNWRNIYS